MAFWQTKSLAEMSDAEWESLCDGCAKCCLHKLEDEDTGEVYYTNVACQLLDIQTCRCQDYASRSQRVPDCLALRRQDLSALAWMPATCAYRLLSEGKPLPAWHPLVSGVADSAVLAGAAISDFAVPESEVAEDEMEDHIIEWLI
jgi:uncharacterized protein